MVRSLFYGSLCLLMCQLICFSASACEYDNHFINKNMYDNVRACDLYKCISTAKSWSDAFKGPLENEIKHNIYMNVINNEKIDIDDAKCKDVSTIAKWLCENGLRYVNKKEIAEKKSCGAIKIYNNAVIGFLKNINRPAITICKDFEIERKEIAYKPVLSIDEESFKDYQKKSIEKLDDCKYILNEVQEKHNTYMSDLNKIEEIYSSCFNIGTLKKINTSIQNIMKNDCTIMDQIRNTILKNENLTEIKVSKNNRCDSLFSEGHDYVKSILYLNTQTEGIYNEFASSKKCNINDIKKKLSSMGLATDPKLVLESLLIRPTQRAPSLGLLIRDLHKKCIKHDIVDSLYQQIDKSTKNYNDNIELVNKCIAKKKGEVCTYLYKTEKGPKVIEGVCTSDSAYDYLYCSANQAPENICNKSDINKECKFNKINGLCKEIETLNKNIVYTCAYTPELSPECSNNENYCDLVKSGKTIEGVCTIRKMTEKVKIICTESKHK